MESRATNSQHLYLRSHRSVNISLFLINLIVQDTSSSARIFRTILSRCLKKIYKTHFIPVRRSSFDYPHSSSDIFP